jgi:hypothetical protein
MLHVAEAFIDKNYHPTVICRGNKIVLTGGSFLQYEIMYNDTTVM